MQQTKLDRWLKESFIYETHIMTLRLPENKLPRGVRIESLDESRGGEYKHRLIVKDGDQVDEVIGLLKADRLMYATKVVEEPHWYNRWIAPEGKSFTFQWINRFIAFVLICFAIYGIYLLMQNETLMKTIKDTIKELRQGV